MLANQRVAAAGAAMGDDRHNLFDLAAANSGHLSMRLAQAEQQHGEPVSRFAEQVQRHGRMGVNASDRVVAKMAAGEALLNRHELDAQATATATETNRAQRSSFHQRRIAFDGSFEDGHRFRYGSLTTGGMAATQYGLICLVLRDPSPLAFLKEDSLRRYVDESSLVVDLAGLSADLAPPSHRGALAAVKHAGAACACDAARWPHLLHGGEGVYIEAVTTADVTMDSVELVRLARSHQRQMVRRVLRARLRDGLEVEQDTESRDYEQWRRAVAERDLPLEVVEDA